MRITDPAGAENKTHLPLVVTGPDNRDGTLIRDRPDRLAVEPHLVRDHRVRSQVVDEDERVVMSLNREGRRAMTENLHLASPARLDPEGRALGSRIPKQRPEHELGCSWGTLVDRNVEDVERAPTHRAIIRRNPPSHGQSAGIADAVDDDAMLRRKIRAD